MTVSGYIFSPQIFTAVIKECNISFERAQNMLSRRKNIFMEANNIKKKLKSLKLTKIMALIYFFFNKYEF